MSKQFFGKYRGVVTDIQDPLMQGRIRAKVPDVFGGDESGWALPCLPFGGDGMGFFVLPDVGGGVWIEFEHGDPEYPVWVGSWFGSSTGMPSELLAPPYQKTLLMTKSGHSITLDDSPGAGGITLKTADGQKIVLTAQGIEIDNGSGAVIKLSGNQVSVNNGALEVM
jgi:uncharacterized protein involved in type VI secretion and phage assembly